MVGVPSEVRDAPIEALTPPERLEGGTVPGWLRLIAPLLVLLLEVAALTPFVEFRSGAIAEVASARVCAGLVFALVAFLLLAGRQALIPLSDGQESGAHRVLLGLAIHLGCYAIFVLFTLWLAADGQGTVASSLAAILWVLLALGVALTAFVAFLPLRLLASWSRRCRGQLLAAAALGVGLYIASPWAQSLWLRVYRPALTLDRQLLQWTYGESITGRWSDGSPVLGTRRLLLRVTPQCSELDALAAFWLLGGAVFLARWRELRLVGALIVLLLGTGLLYLLIAVRLYGLILIGMASSPDVSVNLAHSRVSGILFLGLTVAMLGCSS